MKTLAGVLLGLGLVGCSGDDGGPTGGNNNDNVSLEPGRAVSDSIGPSGGSLTATSSSGVKYTLAFPAGALETFTSISMTPVKAIDSLGVSGLAGAVQLEPSGLKLGKPAVLSIENGGSPGAGLFLVGFNYEGDAESVAAGLVKDSSGVLQILVQHFSGAGAAFATLGQIQALAPSGPGNQSQTYINQLVTLAQASPRDFAAEAGVMRTWMDSVIVPNLANAVNDVALIIAVGDYTFWTQTEIAFGITGADPAFQPERDQAAQAALANIRQAVGDNNSECSANDDLDHANGVLFWQTVAHDFGLDTPANGLDRQSVLNTLCVEIAFLNVTYPNPPVVGQPHSLDVEAELRFRSSGNIQVQPLSFTLTLSGTQQAGPINGLSDPLGNFTAVVTPAQPVMTIEISACLFTAQVPYADVCGTNIVFRGANDLTGTWTGPFTLTDLAFGSITPIQLNLTQNQNAVGGSFEVKVPNGPFGAVSGTLVGDTVFQFTLDGGAPCNGRVINGTARLINQRLEVFLSGPGCNGTQVSGTLFANRTTTPVQGVYLGTGQCSGDPACPIPGGYSFGTMVVQLGDTLFFEGASSFISFDSGISDFTAILSGGGFTGNDGDHGCIFAHVSCLPAPGGNLPLSGGISGTTLNGSYFETDSGFSETFNLQRQ